MPVTLNCGECGSEFRVPPGRKGTAKFCSKNCADGHRNDARKRRVVLSCKGCGNEFETVQCHSGRRIFCSYACKEGDADYRANLSQALSGSRNGRWKGGVSLR